MLRSFFLALVMLLGTTSISEAAPSVRLLILKHCTERMADGDADMAVAAAQRAAEKGLKIKTIGNHHVDRDGKLRVYYSYVDFNDIPKFKEFVLAEMRKQAESGDTVVVFTIGHGFSSGGLQTLGKRTEVMKALAECAEENNQETLWWQLSCYACAGLPSISTLPARQQELFSIVASSTADRVSAAYVQGRHMEKLFVAMAENDRRLDADQDETIMARELSSFLNEAIGNRRGDLVFAANPNEPLFGGMALANKLPIIDHSGPQGNYPKDYVPIPGRR